MLIFELVDKKVVRYPMKVKIIDQFYEQRFLFFLPEADKSQTGSPLKTSRRTLSSESAALLTADKSMKIQHHFYFYKQK